MIVIDTSIWIDHLRGLDTQLESILGSGDELLHPYVHGELLLNGLPEDGIFARKLSSLKTAPVAATADVAAFISWAKLAGTGVGYIDTHLLVSARMVRDGVLLTKDNALRAQAERLGVAYSP